MRHFAWTHTRGFTLVELLTALAVAAILTAIAYPAYQNHIRKGRLAAAKQALLDNAAALEQHYANHLTYKKNSTTWADLPVSQTAHFCIRMQGNPRGTNNQHQYALKAVALDKRQEARVLILNQDGRFLLCKRSSSDCSENHFFANPSRADTQCTSYP